MPRVMALLFLAIAAPLGVSLVELTPLGQVPDEGFHAMRAEALAHGVIVGHRGIETYPDGHQAIAAGVDGDAAALAAMTKTYQLPVTRQAVAAQDAQPWYGRLGFVVISPQAVYPPWFYLPAAIGIWSAKHGGQGPAVADRVGRFCNLAMFLALGFAALWLARRGHGLIFVALSVPMTLALAASFNQDGLLIAASALAAGLLTRGCTRAPLRDAGYLTAVLLLGLVIVDKPPYAPLAALLFLPVTGPRAGYWLGRVLAVAVIAMPALAWTYDTQANVATWFQHPLRGVGPLWPGSPGDMFSAPNPGQQMRVLLADPMRLLTLPWTGLANHAFLAQEIVGVLGWVNLFLPDWLYWAWFVAFGAACGAGLIRAREPSDHVGWADTVIVMLAIWCSVMAICLAQYLSWTDVGQADIGGIQGRYFIPLLPMLAVGWPRLLPSRFGVRGVLLAIPVGAAALGIAVLPGLLIDSFYLH